MFFKILILWFESHKRRGTVEIERLKQLSHVGQLIFFSFQRNRRHDHSKFILVVLEQMFPYASN